MALGPTLGAVLLKPLGQECGLFSPRAGRHPTEKRPPDRSKAKREQPQGKQKKHRANKQDNTNTETTQERRKSKKKEERNEGTPLAKERVSTSALRQTSAPVPWLLEFASNGMSAPHAPLLMSAASFDSLSASGDLVIGGSRV